MTTPLQPQVTNLGTDQGAPTPASLPLQYVQTPPSTYQPSTRYFTEEDVERIRQQEKDKMYQRLEKSEQQLSEFKATVESLAADKKARDDELARQQKAAEDETKRLQEEKLSVQELMEKQRREFEVEQKKLREDMELKLVIAAKEQELLQLKSYIQRRINEEVNATNILPQFVKYIDGATEEEVEASIERAKADTAEIVNAAMGPGSSVPMGTSPTGAPFSPLDRLSGPRQYSLQELQAMPVSSPEYQAYRKARGIDRAGSGQGLF